ncbi:Leucine-rich repeat-containing protein 37A3 [Plecturocebus cupreus]
MSAPPPESTETLNQDFDSIPGHGFSWRAAPPGPEQFAAAHQDLNDKLTRQERLPEVVPVLDWDQNQTPAQPPCLRKQEAPAQHLPASEEIEAQPSVHHEEKDAAQPPEHPEEVDSSSTQLEAQAQPPESSTESAAQTPPNQEVTVQPPDEDQAHYNLANITIKPGDAEVTLTSEPTKKTESSPAQQEVPTQPPEEKEPSAIQDKTPAEPPDPLVEPELSLREQGASLAF